MRLIIVMLVLALAVPAFAMLGQNQMMFIDNERGPVYFPHRDHQAAFQCFVCHHENEEVTQVQSFNARSVAGVKEVKACRECHNMVESIPTFRNVAHRMCKDCHKKLGGPLKCRDCHQYGE